MIFELDEIITLGFTFIALILIIMAYLKSKFKVSKKIWFFFIILFALLFANRLFTNLEAIAYANLFNLLEHFAILMVGLLAILFSAYINNNLEVKND